MQCKCANRKLEGWSEAEWSGRECLGKEGKETATDVSLLQFELTLDQTSASVC